MIRVSEALRESPGLGYLDSKGWGDSGLPKPPAQKHHQPCPPPIPQSSGALVSLPVVSCAGGVCVWFGFLGGSWRPRRLPQERHMSQEAREEGDVWKSGF